MRQTLRTYIIIILAVPVFYIIKNHFLVLYQFVDSLLRINILSYLVTYLIVCLPVLGGVAIIHKKANIITSLGLNGNIFLALGLAVFFTLPMFAYGFFYSFFDEKRTFFGILQATIFAGFFEELVFRGIIFGQIFRYASTGFIPATLFSAVLFASGHLYQGTEVQEILGIFLVTFMGAVFFSWLFAEWNYNLWLPVFLHTLMNLSWTLFIVSDNALGEIQSNIFRGITIALAIIVTIIYKKRKKIRLEINQKNLLWFHDSRNLKKGFHENE